MWWVFSDHITNLDESDQKLQSSNRQVCVEKLQMQAIDWQLASWAQVDKVFHFFNTEIIYLAVPMFQH